MSMRCRDCHLALPLHAHGCPVSDIPPDVSELCEAAWVNDGPCICFVLIEARNLGIELGRDRGLNLAHTEIVDRLRTGKHPVEGTAALLEMKSAIRGLR